MSDGAPVTTYIEPQPIDERTIVELVEPILRSWRAFIAWPLAAALIAFGVTFLIDPTYTARTTLLPPQKTQNTAAAAMQSLGAIAGLAGLGGTSQATSDQFAALLQSANVEDRLIDKFALMKVYDKKYRVDARRELEKRVHINVGKKDGILTIEVDDVDPQRAAAIANEHVTELRRLNSTLAITEPQQRRLYFEGQVKETQASLDAAQKALQDSGFGAAAIKVEPKAAADSYAKLQSEVTAATVRLQTMRGTLADGAPEVRQQQARLNALQAQLSQMESAGAATSNQDYVGKYREFKYRESLLELMTRQYEMAKVDEARDATLIQVIDTATPPEKRSRPRRLLITAATTLVAMFSLLIVVYVRDSWRRAMKAAAPSDAAA